MEGNKMKMREALEYVIQWCENCISEEGADNVDDMIAVVNAALAEPERNCDLFESPKNKTDEQEQKIWDAYNKWCNNPRNRDIDNFPIHSIVGWLLAPATGRKGENNGGK